MYNSSECASVPGVMVIVTVGVTVVVIPLVDLVLRMGSYPSTTPRLGGAEAEAEEVW